MKIGPRIAELRRGKGMSQEDVSEATSLSNSTISKIERGVISDPGFDTVLEIARAVGFKLDDLTVAASSSSDAMDDSKPPKFVYFDVNGVVVRFFQRAFVSISEKHHISPEVIESAFWHYNEAGNVGEMTIAEFSAAIAAKLKIDKVDFEKEYMDAVEPVKAAHDCIRSLSKDHKIGLLTNIMPGFIPKMIKAGLIPDVKYDAIVDSSEVGHVKPEAAIYKIAEKLSGFHGNEILFIDDSRVNLMEAEKLGWRVLWFDDYRPDESVKRIVEATKDRRGK